MPAIPLKIFVHGLIALVPTQDANNMDQMTALLVDGRTAMTEQCMMDHHPQLSFFVGESADCISVPGCTLSGNQCTCKHTTTGTPPHEVEPLLGKRISIEVQPDPTLAPDVPPSEFPSAGRLPTKDNAASFAYVANLAQPPFNLTLNPGYTNKPPLQESNDHLVARMDIPYDRVIACALAMREDAGAAYVHSMSFRPLHVQSSPNDQNHALAQKVIATFDVPDASAGQQVVKLHISDYNGDHDHAFTLLAGPDAYRIDLGNDPDAPLDRDDPCDDGVARHFMHFYDLAVGSPTPAIPLIPHVRFTESVKSTDVTPSPDPCADPIFGLANRPICPLAIYN
jgi:hypothetical protein